jgi:glycosyltransferase involved in cell wall biosynthesis
VDVPPLVSLVIPAYNHAVYLPEAVRSVLAQDYPRLELIVIDDGSTDNTTEVLSELGARFYWESQNNRGQSRTLTRGWSLAKGDVLGYLSADDVLEPGAVRTSVEALMARPDVVATYCDFNLIDPASRRVRTVELPEYSYENMLAQVACPIGPGAFFLRSAYLRSGPWNPDYRQMPDYDFWLRLGLQGRFLHLPYVLAGFRVHEGSQTYSMTTPERAAEPVLIVSGVLNERVARDLDSGLKECALASANLVSAQLHLRAGRFYSAFLCIRQAYRYSGRTVLTWRSLRMLSNAVINRTAHRLLWKARSMRTAGRERARQYPA